MQPAGHGEHRLTSAAHQHRRGLFGALLLSSAILVMELAAGLAGNSVALLADAGHVFADVSGMALAAVAVWLANRRATEERSFGMYRVEILAAGLNAVLLFAIAAFVMWQGIQRLLQPEDVQSGLMIVVAGLALGLNLLAVALLQRGQKVA